jgi:drug/metabolite transporter (DMT)-like permease
MTGIVWGLLGAGFIGVSDCVARVTARQVSMALLLAAVMGLSTLALSVWMIATGAWPLWHAYGWIASAISGGLNLIALFLLYSALVRGPVSVASPAASSFSVMLVGLNALAGAPFVWQQGVAVGMVFIGITMLARRGRRGDSYDVAHLRTTALLGLAAALVVSLRMFLAQEAADVLGAMQALYLNRVFALIGVGLLLVFDRARGRQQQWPRGALVWLVLVQATLETLALGSFLIGSVGTGRIGASIGFSSFAAVTALTAWVWLGEPIGWRRGFWMVVVAAGIAVAIAAAP